MKLGEFNQKILKASKKRKNHNSLKALQLMCTLFARICQLCVVKMISEKTLCSKGFTSYLTYFYTKIIVIIIPTDLVTNVLLSIFVLSQKPKTRIKFSASWWPGNEKCFCSLFTASGALLQSHAEFSRLLERNFLICYSCSYYRAHDCIHKI